jgi:ferredoxin
VKIKIDKDTCIGCGLCEELLPDVVTVGSYHAKVTRSELLAEEETPASAAAQDCPVGAISFSADGPSEDHDHEGDGIE